MSVLCCGFAASIGVYRNTQQYHVINMSTTMKTTDQKYTSVPRTRHRTANMSTTDQMLATVAAAESVNCPIDQSMLHSQELLGTAAEPGQQMVVVQASAALLRLPAFHCRSASSQLQQLTLSSHTTLNNDMS